MKLYLLEAYNPEIEYDDGIIVALTPEACYHLDKINVEYTIIEDHYCENELFKDRICFLQEQYEWFEHFDWFLKTNLDFLTNSNLNPAQLYSSKIKSNVLDPLIFKARTLGELFDKFEPSKIVFVSLPRQKNELDESLIYKTKSIYEHIIPIICKERSVELINLFGFTKQNKVHQKNKLQDKLRHIIYLIQRSPDLLSIMFRKKNKKHKNKKIESIAIEPRL